MPSPTTCSQSRVITARCRDAHSSSLMGLPLGMKPRKAARWAPKVVITGDYCPPSDGEHGPFGSDYLSNGPTSSAAEAGHEGTDPRDEPRLVVCPELGPRAQRAGVRDAVDEE